MSTLAAALLLLLQSDPRDRLFDAIRDTSVEGTQKALADLVQGDGARAARVVLAALPRARERLNVLIAVTQRARDNYMTADTSFGFNINEAVVKQKALERAAERIKETAAKAIEGEKVYQSILDIFAFLKPEAVPVLAAEAERTALWPLKCEILEGLGAMGSKEARQALAVAIDREASPAALATALRVVPSEEAARYLGHAQWQVRISALEALRQSRNSVGVIVDAMGRADFRFRKQATRTLIGLTETELPPDAGAWSDWWKANRDDFASGSYSARAPKLPEGPGRTVAFYDIPVHSTRVCFVIDRSRSMKEQDRFDHAKAELKRLLHTLPDGSLVNIVFFGASHSSFARFPKKLEAGSRREMVTYVENMSLEPATDLYGALEKGLSMVGNPDTGKLLEEGVDTIVVLSDGQATWGRIIDDELLTLVVTRRARYLRPVFHTVSLSNDSKSLRLLAERTGGEYRAK
jgi:hypothetical protein